MDELTILRAALHHSDTLYCLLQHQQEEYKKRHAGSATGNEKLWNCKSAGLLREKLYNINLHMQVFRLTSGKTLEEAVSRDVFYVITRNLTAIKVYLYSVVNMSSPYFRADYTTPGILHGQIVDIIEVVEDVQATLENCDVSSDIVKNVTTVFDTNVADLGTAFRSGSNDLLDGLSEPIRQNVDVFRRFVDLAQSLRHGNEGPMRNMNEDFSSGSDDCVRYSAGRRDLLTLIPVATAALITDLSERGGENQARSNLLQQMTSLWTGWQVNHRDVSYELDEFHETVSLDQSATSMVHDGVLKTGEGKPLQVAVKTKQMTNGDISDALHDVFIHLMVQHHSIVTLFGICYPKPTTESWLILVERMHGTLAHALEVNEIAVHKRAVLRDTAAGLAHLHDKGIVHQHVDTYNILVDKDYTSAKLSGVGSSRSQSTSTMISKSPQQRGTSFYLAPEMQSNPQSETTPKMDCWAFGLLVCEVMNRTGRDAFVHGCRVDLAIAARAWASGISEEWARLGAMACVELEAQRRPTMREMYLHLAGVMAIGEEESAVMVTGMDVFAEGGKSFEPAGSSRSGGGGTGIGGTEIGARTVDPYMASTIVHGRDWKEFCKVETGFRSATVDVLVKNQMVTNMVLSVAQPDGLLHPVELVSSGAVVRHKKTRRQAGRFFVLLNRRSRALHAAVAAEGWITSVIMGSSFAHFLVHFPNLANKGGAQWPRRSMESTGYTHLNILNNWYSWDMRVNRVDNEGTEVAVIEKVRRRSDCQVQAPCGSLLVIRCLAPGHSYDEAFLCAVGIPPATSEFAVQLDSHIPDNPEDLNTSADAFQTAFGLVSEIISLTQN